MESTLRKLRETEYFLNKFKQHASVMQRQEEAEFYLSALLSAGRSVTLVLQVEHKQEYDQVFASCESGLQGEDSEMFKRMNTERVAAVHQTGPNFSIQQESIPIYNFYQDSTGTITVAAPPAIFMTGPPATIFKPTYYFQMNDEPREVSIVCSRYYSLLSDLVEKVSKILRRQTAANRQNNDARS